MLYFISILLTDPNCIQIRAPRDFNDQNQGVYCPGEHIGHLTKDFSSKIAPILVLCEAAYYPAFECHLQYTDTNHSRAGYDVDVIIRNFQTTMSNQELFRLLEGLHLSPSWV